MLDQFEWPEPEHEADKVVLRNVRNHGCHITGIPDANPPFAFSIGLYLNYGHPELIIFGQSFHSAQAIINLIRDRAAAGHKFVDGDISDELLENGYKLGFWQVPFAAYPDYLGIAIWFYRKSRLAFPCLQVVWQDVDRHFPWEADCSLDVRRDQPLLKRTVS
ncbi:DUF4262 domain-containing protein [Bradyrhizobium sp. CCGUVB14]|uniref:DUF4262 domain-containing protein n=1 Tax=Bradyrhizobium sp. CCGUVB14 TaxID=2949628 RepID=UPI0020B2732D|nr:DUF4262 domain-containing protein [Bradyrhizobium sp. CCGUVB14]MCP3446465.1 DUF4262 domain-containing protein [Bradyrhizobium sp. CCGUVB14]